MPRGPSNTSRVSRRGVLRRGLALASLGLVTGCALPPLGAPSAGRGRRIGVLSSNTRAGSPALDAFVGELRERGWDEGRNLTIDWREAQGRPDRYRPLAAELARLHPEAIVAQSSGLVEAARAASAAIPIVALALPADPVELGWAASLARPGGNVTGTVVPRELDAKRVELLQGIVPGLTRLGILWTGRPDPSVLQGIAVIEAAARALGVEPISLEISTQAPDIEAAFSGAAELRVDGLVVYQSAQLNLQRARIARLASRAALPAIYPTRAYVANGGLMSYGPDFTDLYRRTARHVDQILRGARPAELPIEQPESFELVINLAAARSLGLSIPRSLLPQATELIE